MHLLSRIFSAFLNFLQLHSAVSRVYLFSFSFGILTLIISFKGNIYILMSIENLFFQITKSKKPLICLRFFVLIDCCVKMTAWDKF